MTDAQRYWLGLAGWYGFCAGLVAVPTVGLGYLVRRYW